MSEEQDIEAQYAAHQAMLKLIEQAIAEAKSKEKENNGSN
jgi:hypothetical protein